MTLHDRIRAVVEERLRLARALRGEPWELDGDTVNGSVFVYGFLGDGNVEAIGRYIAANDPADAILSAEHALSVLERHKPTDRDEFRYGITCAGCPNSATSFPCIEIRDLATRWRVEVDG